MEVEDPGEKLCIMDDLIGRVGNKTEEMIGGYRIQGANEKGKKYVHYAHLQA